MLLKYNGKGHCLKQIVSTEQTLGGTDYIPYK